MNNSDEIVAGLASAILRTAAFDIEAANLDAIVEDSAQATLDAALASASGSERKGGAFGMEIAGAIIIPVLVTAVQQFWSAYQKRIIEKLGVQAADATIAHVKKWFTRAAPDEAKAAGDELTEAIRREGRARGMRDEDLDALVAAVAPERLQASLATADQPT